MAARRRFVLQFNALTIIVLLFPVCIAQLSGTLTDNSDTMSQGSSGFGYELLRNQLDEMQASILQLQQIAERRNECAGLNNNIANILNRLETIEKGLKASSSGSSAPSAATNFPAANFDEDRLRNIIGNIMKTRQRDMQHQFNTGMRNTPVQETTPTPSIYDRVYDSCEDVPSSGVWKIRYGIQISNVNCIKF